MNVYFEVIMSNKWKNLNIKPNQQEMYNIAMRARYNIWSRTKSGRDYLGYPFAPYSEKYRLIREKLHKTTCIVTGKQYYTFLEIGRAHV